MKLKAENIMYKHAKLLAVNDVSIEVRAGQVVGLLGPNGAGKTTTFRIICGILKPLSGSIYLDDIDISDKPMHIRARRGLCYLPQESSVFKGLNTKQNLLVALENRKDLNASTRRIELARLLKEHELESLGSTHAGLLSGGERRRLELARAMATNPSILLLDEPFAGVDPLAIELLHKKIADLAKKGIGLLITDHNASEMLRVCDHCYILSGGKVVSQGTTEELLADKIARERYFGPNFQI